MSRILFLVLFLGVILVGSDASAQDDQKRTKTSVAPAHSRVQHREARTFRKRLFGRRSSPRAAYSVAPQKFTSRPLYRSDPSFPPKFIGGFHSSHFSNIGIPTGDIGFRGNGIYWAPW